MMNIFKNTKPFPLSDSQVIKEAVKNVDLYFNGRKASYVDIDRCVESALSRITDIWKSAREIGRRESLNREQQQELVELIVRVQEPIEQQARKRAMELLKQQKSSEIEKTTIDALLRAKLNEEGFPHYTTWQKYRVKVNLLLSKNRVMTFFVRLKDFRENKMHQVVDSALGIARQINNIDFDIELSYQRSAFSTNLWIS